MCFLTYNEFNEQPMVRKKYFDVIILRVFGEDPIFISGFDMKTLSKINALAMTKRHKTSLCTIPYNG